MNIIHVNKDKFRYFAFLEKKKYIYTLVKLKKFILLFIELHRFSLILW